MENLHPNVRQQLAQIRRDLKTKSKNDVVRAVLGLMVEISKMNQVFKRQHDEITSLKKDAEIAEGFLKQNEEAFQAYVDALPKEKIDANTPVDAPPSGQDNTVEGASNGAA